MSDSIMFSSFQVCIQFKDAIIICVALIYLACKLLYFFALICSLHIVQFHSVGALWIYVYLKCEIAWIVVQVLLQEVHIEWGSKLKWMKAENSHNSLNSTTELTSSNWGIVGKIVAWRFDEAIQV